MHIVMVNVHVKADYVEPFIAATLDNAKASAQEVGVTRFEFFQMKDDPTRFLLQEIYRTPEDQLKHRETAHYQTWRSKVSDWMAEPREGVLYTDLSAKQAGR